MDELIAEEKRMARKNGGNMYPLEYSAEQGGGYQEGISRRDWLAGLAMQGLLADQYDNDTGEDVMKIAECSYEIADAMIEEGEK